MLKFVPSDKLTDFFKNPESRASLPGIAFADYKRRYQEPTLDEGFEDIHPVPFRFVGDEEAKRIWGQYWV